jgi:hypothetical protein
MIARRLSDWFADLVLLSWARHFHRLGDDRTAQVYLDRMQREATLTAPEPDDRDDDGASRLPRTRP